MHYFDSKDLEGLSKIYRLNLINSVTGYKSANLIGTQNSNGITNLAIFSSVIHLGSNPALIGFVLRPTTVPRHTYSNLKATNDFTLNTVTKDYINDAHHTSAKYPEEISEFDVTNFSIEHKNKMNAPYVKGSPIQIGCNYENEYHIKENNTLLIIGSIKELYISQNLLLDDGWVQLENENIITINGLDGYAVPKLINRFPYARPKS